MTDRHGHIPIVRLSNEEVWAAVLPRLEELVASGRFTLDRELEEFESAAAQRFGGEWCVGTSSGTSALILALKASDLPSGSRVAIPANTFFATLEAVVLAGHVPVVVDCDDYYLVDLEQLEELDVAAVIPVHLFGLPVDMPAVISMAQAHGWWVLEDCSQAHGATIGNRPVGSFGHAAAFSAYPTKNLGAWGDAGFVVGRDADLEERMRALRHHGQRASNRHDLIGGTERMDNLQALVLRDKLERLPAEVEARRRVAEQYRRHLGDASLALPGDIGDRRHAYHQFVIRVSDRARVRERLERDGIGSAIHYPTPVHLQPAARGHCEVPARPRRAEQAAEEVLSLPIYPALTEDDVARVSQVLIDALEPA